MTQYAVTDPATGEVIREYPTATDAQIDDAIAAAHGAARTWARSSTVAERSDLVRRVGDLHTERRDELAAIIKREMGKPVDEGLGEVDFAADIYHFYADNAERFLADEPIDLLAGEGTAVVRRRPIGVLLGIMPWNFPYYQVARFAGPNLAIGNTVLLKHAPQCPESSAAMQQIFLDAGFPAGAYVNIYATNDQAATIIADPRVAAVSLTGSERAGAAVAEVAGRNLKKVVLELGGSDPFLVLSTDDLDATVQAAIDARFDNTGQSCNAAKRFIVTEDLYQPFVERFTAAAVQRGEGIAPLSSVAAAERIEAQVQQAVDAGATLCRRRRARRRPLPARRPDRREPGEPRVPGRVLRPGLDDLQGQVRGRGRRAGQRHLLRPRLVPVHHRPRAGDPGGRPDRRRHGVRQRRTAGRCRAALRRHQALRVRTGDGPLRDG